MIGHYALLLAHNRFSVLEKLLRRVIDSQALWVPMAGLRKLFLDILYGGLICDLNARGQLLDGLLGDWWGVLLVKGGYLKGTKYVLRLVTLRVVIFDI